jgi:phosphoribosyl 1,2-cyclic phosphate phosphodiesterase
LAIILLHYFGFQGSVFRFRISQFVMSSLELTFLGTGTSHGVPVIGCDCEVCRSTDPRDSRTRTSLLVKAPDCHFVIDTAPDFRIQCLRERITRLDAALFTHAHTDHIMGFDDVRRFCEMNDRKMPVFASPATMEGLRKTFRYVFDEPQPWKNYLRIEPEEITAPFQLGETTIVPVDLPHGRFTTTGYILHRGGRKLLAYFTDCSELTGEAVEAAHGAEVLIVDALRERPHPTHMTIAQALEASRSVAPESTYLIHLCHDVSHAAMETQLPAGCHLAYDGLTINVGA